MPTDGVDVEEASTVQRRPQREVVDQVQVRASEEAIVQVAQPAGDPSGRRTALRRFLVVVDVVQDDPDQDEVGFEAPGPGLQHKQGVVESGVAEPCVHHLDPPATAGEGAEAPLEPLGVGLRQLDSEPEGDRIADGEDAKDLGRLGKEHLAVPKAEAVDAHVNPAEMAGRARPIQAEPSFRVVSQELVGVVEIHVLRGDQANAELEGDERHDDGGEGQEPSDRDGPASIVCGVHGRMMPKIARPQGADGEGRDPRACRRRITNESRGIG